MQAVQDRLGRPFLLENITYYVDPRGGLSEPQFITEVLERSDCGLLLDLNNLALNAINHDFDAQEFLAEIPLERVIQVHLAGNGPGASAGGMLLDSHDAPVGDDVFHLLRVLAERNPPQGVLIERDDRFPDDFQEIMDDLTRARAVLSQEMS
ncbi:DUF692 family protein [Nonomuraea sp. K274]|uniref:DUF692 family protein n=1 Tax=Nonomuraea cypriaca TaxID=1187855 RepID=A0A931AD74_9ACTN|nr:DUF692 family multinuclear iron-containing protein [Nonomuraea cypriaca]MBF8190696.1 DUF692 family protein [Nonomuraea cypriaca]